MLIAIVLAAVPTAEERMAAQAMADSQVSWLPTLVLILGVSVAVAFFPLASEVAIVWFMEEFERRHPHVYAEWRRQDSLRMKRSRVRKSIATADSSPHREEAK